MLSDLWCHHCFYMFEMIPDHISIRLFYAYFCVEQSFRVTVLAPTVSILIAILCYAIVCSYQRNNNINERVIKSLVYSLYYAEACNEFAGPISASLRLRATQILSKKYRSGGEPLATLCPLNGPRFEPQNSRSETNA